MGKAQTVDVIEVKWPTTQKIERFTQVKANQILTIREGSGIVDPSRLANESRKMKALLLSQYRHLELTDLAVPEPGHDEVLIRVAACGICGSDVHGYDGSSGRRIPPIVMGHEAAGTVAAVGESVSRAFRKAIASHLIRLSIVANARPALAGEINLCDRRQVLGVSCGDYRRAGAFAEFVVVPARIVHRLPDNLSFAEAAMLEAVAVALHAVSLVPSLRAVPLSLSAPARSDCLLQQALRVAGCSRVFVADVDPTRLQLSLELGATATLSAAIELPQQILQLTNGAGVDIAVEAVGKTETVNTAIDSVRKGGSVVLVGNISPAGHAAAAESGHSSDSFAGIVRFRRRISARPSNFYPAEQFASSLSSPPSRRSPKVHNGLSGCMRANLT